MFGKKPEPERSFWSLHADIQSFVSTIDEAVEKGGKEVGDLEQTIREAEAQKSAINDGVKWLSEVRKVFPLGKQ